MMAENKQPRSLETAAGLPIQHLNKLGVEQMNDNIVEVISGICCEVQPTGCMISTISKKSRGYANKRLRINGEWKTLKVHRLVLKNNLELPMKPEYFACQACLRNCINFNHKWSFYRRSNFQYRLNKGWIKDVKITSAPQPKKQQRVREIIAGIRAKRSDGYSVKTIRINGKNQSFYPHRLVLEHKLGRSVKPGYFACDSCEDRGCVNPDHLWEGTPADNSRDAKGKKPLSFRSRQDMCQPLASNPNRCARFA